MIPAEHSLNSARNSRRVDRKRHPAVVPQGFDPLSKETDPLTTKSTEFTENQARFYYESRELLE